MAKVALIAKLNAQPGKGEEIEQALTALAGAADEEAGLEIYAAHRDPNSPDTIWFYELYADDEALGVHGSGDKMKAAMGTLGGLLAGAPEIHVLAPLAAKGLDF